MSVRDILLHLDTGETARAATDFAVSLAEATGAHLTAAGLAIEYVAMGGLEDTGSYAYLAEATEQNRANVEAAYQSLAAEVPAGVQTDFVLLQTVAGVARDRFGELARHFDLAVVGQLGHAAVAVLALLTLATVASGAAAAPVGAWWVGGMRQQSGVGGATGRPGPHPLPTRRRWRAPTPRPTPFPPCSLHLGPRPPQPPPSPHLGVSPRAGGRRAGLPGARAGRARA